jgi:putative PEP-CTERM system histidine kinase
LDLDWAGVVLYAALLIGSVLVVMNLERTFRAAVGTMRWRIKFTLMGVGLLFIVRIYTSSQALLFRGVDLHLEMLNSAALAISAVLIARSFFRKRQFDVTVYPSQSVLQNSITVLLAGVYLVVVGILAKVAAYVGGDNEFALKAFLALISLVALAILLQSDRIRMQLRRFVSRNFQRPLYDYRTVWRKFTEGTASRVEKDDLCRSLVKMVADVFQSLSVAIWLWDDNREGMGLAASTFLSEGAAPALKFTQPMAEELMRSFLAHPEAVDLDASGSEWVGTVRERHRNQFPDGGHRICVPLISQGEVIGLMTLGDRVGGVPFSLQDFDMLRCVADDAAVGLRNAQLSQRLLQARELEAFQTMAAFFVHDLKNAASTLNLMLQNLPVHFDDPAFREDALRGVSKTVTHINRLIGRLGQLRHEHGIQTSEQDLNEIIAGALSALEQGTGSMISKDLQPLPRVMLDREQFAKVVTNLVINATEAVSPGGRVQVSTRLEANWAVLSVRDNGSGMSREFLANGLFRPFQTTKKTGIGIGMFQSKMIVESHGGRIAVASEQGNGTTFEVFIPLIRPSP